MKLIKQLAASMSLVLFALTLSATAMSADDGLPDKTTDGLTRVDSKKVQALYVQEGATLAPYTKVMLVDCAVAFRKDWMRDYNRERIDLSSRVSSKDMDKIKAALAAEFKTEFTKVLEAGGYAVVEETGEDVLLLRPALINLDISAPDINNASMSRTFVASAGQMTLYMELYDSATGAKFGEVVDAQAARDRGTMHYANRVTNKADADIILKKWANLLVDALNEAKAGTN